MKYTLSQVNDGVRYAIIKLKSLRNHLWVLDVKKNVLNKSNWELIES